MYVKAVLYKLKDRCKEWKRKRCHCWNPISDAKDIITEIGSHLFMHSIMNILNITALVFFMWRIFSSGLGWLSYRRRGSPPGLNKRGYCTYIAWFWTLIASLKIHQCPLTLTILLAYAIIVQMPLVVTIKACVLALCLRTINIIVQPLAVTNIQLLAWVSSVGRGKMIIEKYTLLISRMYYIFWNLQSTSLCCYTSGSTEW